MVQIVHQSGGGVLSGIALAGAGLVAGTRAYNKLQARGREAEAEELALEQQRQQKATFEALQTDIAQQGIVGSGGSPGNRGTPQHEDLRQNPQFMRQLQGLTSEQRGKVAFSLQLMAEDKARKQSTANIGRLMESNAEFLGEGDQEGIQQLLGSIDQGADPRKVEEALTNKFESMAAKQAILDFNQSAGAELGSLYGGILERADPATQMRGRAIIHNASRGIGKPGSHRGELMRMLANAEEDFPGTIPQGRGAQGSAMSGMSMGQAPGQAQAPQAGPPEVGSDSGMIANIGQAQSDAAEYDEAVSAAKGSRSGASAEAPPEDPERRQPSAWERKRQTSRTGYPEDTELSEDPSSPEGKRKAKSRKSASDDARDEMRRAKEGRPSKRQEKIESLRAELKEAEEEEAAEFEREKSKGALRKSSRSRESAREKDRARAKAKKEEKQQRGRTGGSRRAEHKKRNQ